MKKEEGSYDNSFGVASFILGLLSVLFSFTIVPSLIFAILAIIFAVKQIKRNKNGWSTWGLILAIVGIILTILVIFGVIALISQATVVADLISKCQADPTAAGCEQVAQFIQSTTP